MVCLCAAVFTRADSIESTSGAIVDGKIVSRDDKMIVIDVQVGGKIVQRRYAIHLVRAVTIGGQRELIGQAGKSTPTPSGKSAERTRKEIEDLIAAGKTPPDWLDSTPLNYPKSLDLSYPEKPQGGWNNQKNVGQFYWDVINPNPNKWREGVKLLHHLMDQHKGDAEKQQRLAQQLGGIYHHLFQDWARAAYWMRQSGHRQEEIALAECYWKLGSKAMALEILNRLRSFPMSAIKLQAELGDLDRALKLAELFADGPGMADAYVLAGDACRNAGKTTQATTYYQKVASVPDTSRNKRAKDRARASLEAIKLFDSLDLAKIPDGAYRASSLGYEAPIEIEVKVSGAKIISVAVTRHREKQFYASITDTTAQIVQKQSVKGIDATSRATITSDAIINATAKALHGAMK